MSPIKTIVFIILLAGLTYCAWALKGDPLFCVYTFIAGLFFLSILFQFPDKTHLMLDGLKHLETEKGEIDVSLPQATPIKTLIRTHPDVAEFETSKIRHHDSLKLISDTQKGIFIGFVFYLFIFLIALLVSYLVNNYSVSTDPRQLKFYKEVLSIPYISIAFMYVLIYFFPVKTQRSKNEMTIQEGNEA